MKYAVQEINTECDSIWVHLLCDDDYPKNIKQLISIIYLGSQRGMIARTIKTEKGVWITFECAEGIPSKMIAQILEDKGYSKVNMSEVPI